MQLPDKHPLLPGFRITHQHRHAIGVVPGTPPHPADNVLVVEIVVLLAVREELARKRQVGDFSLCGGGAPVVGDAAFEAVEVAVEEAGVFGSGRTSAWGVQKKGGENKI